MVAIVLGTGGVLATAGGRSRHMTSRFGGTRMVCVLPAAGAAVALLAVFRAHDSKWVAGVPASTHSNGFVPGRLAGTDGDRRRGADPGATPGKI